MILSDIKKAILGILILLFLLSKVSAQEIMFDVHPKKLERSERSERMQNWLSKMNQVYS